MSYQDDKRELLKLKQGLIEESETIREEEKPVYELHGRKRVANFFYHYKWHVIVGAFFLAVVGFFLYDLLKDDVGDLRILVVAKDHDVAANVGYKTHDLELAFEQYCPDFDDNGYVHVDVYNIDLSENVQADYMLGNVTKLTGEIGYGEAQMYLLDTPALESITTDGDLSGFVNLEERYVEACPEDLFLVIRKVGERTANRDRAEKAQRRALEVMDNIVNTNLSGWKFEEGRIYGITE